MAAPEPVQIKEVARLDVRDARQGQYPSHNGLLAEDESGELVLYLDVEEPTLSAPDQEITIEIQQRDKAGGNWIPAKATGTWRSGIPSPYLVAMSLDAGAGAELRGHDVRGCLSSKEEARCGLRLVVEQPPAVTRDLEGPIR